MELEIPELHTYLNGSAKYKVALPFYIDDLLTDEEDEQIKSLVNNNINQFTEMVQRNNERMTEVPSSRYVPKRVETMSRLMTEFDMPENILSKLDSIAKPIYDGDIALAHYIYIDYAKKHSDYRQDPTLSPHLDGDNNLVTINYCIDGNIDWDIYVGDMDDQTNFTRYTLKKGQAIVFSAINQVHWRPRRKFADDEFLQIVSMDYCPTTNYIFTGQKNPLDPIDFPERRESFSKEQYFTTPLQEAWKMYRDDSAALGLAAEG
jgi:hypothetical protein